MKRGALLLALLAGACASSQNAPISYGGAGRSTSSAPPRENADPPSHSTGRAPIEFRNGSLGTPASSPVDATTEEEAALPARTPAVQEAPDWADGEGTPLSAYALQPDEVQPYDPANLPRMHRVSGNESLYDVATRYQVPLRALIDQNGLEPPYALAPGRELRLPPPRIHTAARGESFEDIARAYNVDLRSLALLNRMAAPYAVRTGDRVVLPAMARALGPAPPAPTPIAAPPPTGPRLPPAAGARFAMPLRGEIAGRFGAQPSGGRLDGVEITGEEGDAVTAAADGDVVYAGDDLPAYGTLVLIRHADNYVTAYGFTRRALVREGQRVRAGQHIAELGARADGEARLLFQVRQGSAAVDPAPLLGIRH